jgi:hypothetical protein
MLFYPILARGGLALSDSEKAEALANSLKAQFQPVNDPPEPALIEMVNEAMRAYEYVPASEPKLTSPSEVLQAIKGLKVGKAPGPNGLPNRVLKHLPKRAKTLLTKVFNAVHCRQYSPPAWKNACVVSILKPGKDPMLPSSYRPISLIDTIGKPFEKILLSRVLKEVNERGLLRDEQFGFRSRLSTTLQLAHLVERVNRNLDERRLTGAVFLDVANAFDTVWIEVLLYKLTVLNFLSYLVKTISSTSNIGRSKRPSSQLHPPVAACGLVPTRVELFPLCCSACMQTTCRRRLATSSWHSTRKTWLLWPCPSAPPLSSTSWRLTSAGYRIGGFLSTSLRARRCSSQRGQFSFSESQQRGSKRHDVSG